MANPTVSNVKLDKTSYAPGDTVRLAFDVADADNKSYSIAITALDSAGNPGTGGITFNIVDVVSASVTDSGTRTWVKDTVKSTGTHYEFTATA